MSLSLPQPAPEAVNLEDLAEAVETMRDLERTKLKKMHRKAGTCYWCAHHSNPRLATTGPAGTLRGFLYHQNGRQVEGCALTTPRRRT